MVRWSAWAVALCLGATAFAQASPVAREYLAETVRRGLPVLSEGPGSSVPFWPRLERHLRTEQALAPSPDLELIEGWMLLHQDRPKEASALLTDVWVSSAPGVQATSVQKAEAWFAVLSRLDQGEDLLRAWQSWDQKSLSPTVLNLALRGLSKDHAAAVGAITRQAFLLYPDDHRWLTWMLEHPSDFPQVTSLVARDRARGPGLMPSELLSLLRRSPSVRPLLLAAGYTDAELASAVSRDYATWATAASATTLANGVWDWDRDGDGRTDHRVVYDQGHLSSWSRGDLGPESESWTLAFQGQKPSVLHETHRDALWTLEWEDYPWVATLSYHYGSHDIAYRFAPYQVKLPLSPRELPQGREALWPWLWDQDGRALSLPGLVTQASSVVISEGQRWHKTLALFGGQVWSSVEDADGDGLADLWTFYRAGKLDRVYRRTGAAGPATLQELYQDGEYQALLANPSATGRTEFALFPAEGVQLWDPEGTGEPLIRWVSDVPDLKVLAFGGSDLPWATMPPWTPQP